MGKKRVHPEFHEYVKGLERIKSDVEKFGRIVKSEANVEDRLEDVIPCLKRILERIVYGCLVIQIPVYGKTTSAKRWRNKKASELVREVDPEFYPCPNLDRGVPYVKIANGVRDCNALTKEQWLTAWDFVNQIQHVQNPASDKRKPAAHKSHDSALKWTQRAVNLLSHHSIITTDTAFFGQATMHPASRDVQVVVMERVESWSPVHRLANGNTVTLQRRNDDGRWRDIQDPKEGAISFLHSHGVYTRRGFMPA